MFIVRDILLAKTQHLRSSRRLARAFIKHTQHNFEEVLNSHFVLLSEIETKKPPQVVILLEDVVSQR